MKFDIKFEGPADPIMAKHGAINFDLEGYDAVYVGLGKNKVEAFVSARNHIPKPLQDEIELGYPPEFTVEEADGVTYHVYCIIRVKHD